MKTLKRVILNVLLGAAIGAVAGVLLAATVKSGGVETNTVLITNFAQNSGGSGSVVAIMKDESEILTNAHVCGLLKKGGLVVTDTGMKYAVSKFKTDTIHDLCLVVINTKLNSKAKLALEPAALYSDATTTGHPALLPNIITKGHFSNNKMISVVTGIKKCTPEEVQSRLECLFFGGLPIIRNYMSTVVSTLIMPGSSGSGVYNANDELTTVIFAGMSDIGYGFAVPQEYISVFLDKYLNGKGRETFTTPKNEASTPEEEMLDAQAIRAIKNKCAAPELPVEVRTTCAIFGKSQLW